MDGGLDPPHYWGNIGRAALGLVSSILLLGCAVHSAFEKPTEFQSLQQAVNVNVTTLSVGRWEDYAAALQAQFTITPDLALTLALPQTSISQNSVADALSFGLQIAPAPASSGQSASPSAPAAGASGSASAAAAATAANSGGTASAGGSSTPAAAPSAAGIPVPTGTLQTDAILSYTAATAIYQEVQLLNRYVQDAALRYGYVPYVARIQVSVMPFARNEPYDLYLDLGLFSHCYGHHQTAPTPAFAVPLLVTDDIEKGQATTAEDIARQLALSVAGTVHSFGVGGSASDLSNEIKSVLASSFNSLFMVSRGSSDNVLQIRFGAASNPVVNSGFTMLAQTHNVTFLLLVKQTDAALDEGGCDAALNESEADARISGPVVDGISIAHLRNVKSGVEVPVQPRIAVTRARKIVERIQGSGWHTHVPDSALSTFITDVKGSGDGNFRDLQTDMGAAGLDPAYAETLWTGLSTAASESEYRSLIFNLPYPARHPHVAHQTIFVLDNCKDTATVSLMGPGDIAPGQFLAELRLHDGDYRVAATKVSQSAGGAPWTITFPSLHELARDVEEIKNACATGSATPPLPKRLESAKLIVHRVVDSRWNTLRGSLQQPDRDPACLGKCDFEFDTVVFDGTAQSALTVGLTAGADSIAVDPTAGTGKVRLILKIDKDLDGVVIAFGGASVAALPTVTGTATVTQTNGGLTVAPITTGAATTVVLDVALQGLVSGRAVTVTGTGQKNQKPTTSPVPILVIPIVGPSTPPKTTTG